MIIPGRVAGTSNACTDDDRRQLTMMIEEGMAMRIARRSDDERGDGGGGAEAMEVEGYRFNCQSRNIMRTWELA